MDNQHRKITGYRELEQAEIDLMNDIKEKGVVLERLCERVEKHLARQHAAFPEMHEFDQQRIEAAQGPRWLSIARADLQKGLMELVRAVAQPTTF